MRTEIKLAQLLSLAPTHVQSGINSNLCLCFKLHKNILGISPFWCLDTAEYNFSEKKLYSTKVVLLDILSAENINTLSIF